MVFFGLGVFIRPPTFGIACIDAHSIRDGRGRPRSLGDEPNGWSNYRTNFPQALIEPQHRLTLQRNASADIVLWVRHAAPGTWRPSRARVRGAEMILRKIDERLEQQNRLMERQTSITERAQSPPLTVTQPAPTVRP